MLYESKAWFLREKAMAILRRTERAMIFRECSETLIKDERRFSLKMKKIAVIEDFIEKKLLSLKVYKSFIRSAMLYESKAWFLREKAMAILRRTERAMIFRECSETLIKDERRFSLKMKKIAVIEDFIEKKLLSLKVYKSFIRSAMLYESKAWFLREKAMAISRRTERAMIFRECSETLIKDERRFSLKMKKIAVIEDFIEKKLLSLKVYKSFIRSAMLYESKAWFLREKAMAILRRTERAMIFRECSETLIKDERRFSLKMKKIAVIEDFIEKKLLSLKVYKSFIRSAMLYESKAWFLREKAMAILRRTERAMIFRECSETLIKDERRFSLKMKKIAVIEDFIEKKLLSLKVYKSFIRSAMLYESKAWFLREKAMAILRRTERAMIFRECSETLIKDERRFSLKMKKIAVIEDFIEKKLLSLKVYKSFIRSAMLYESKAWFLREKAMAILRRTERAMIFRECSETLIKDERRFSLKMKKIAVIEDFIEKKLLSLKVYKSFIRSAMLYESKAWFLREKAMAILRRTERAMIFRECSETLIKDERRFSLKMKKIAVIEDFIEKKLLSLKVYKSFIRSAMLYESKAWFLREKAMAILRRTERAMIFRECSETLIKDERRFSLKMKKIAVIEDFIEKKLLSLKVYKSFIRSAMLYESKAWFLREKAMAILRRTERAMIFRECSETLIKDERRFSLKMKKIAVIEDFIEKKLLSLKVYKSFIRSAMLYESKAWFLREKAMAILRRTERAMI